MKTIPAELFGWQHNETKEITLGTDPSRERAQSRSDLWNGPGDSTAIKIGVHPVHQRCVKALRSQAEWLRKSLTINPATGEKSFIASDSSIAERVLAIGTILSNYDAYLAKLQEDQ